MKLGIYCRVSTEEQTKGNSIDSQIRKGIEVCEMLECEYEIYTEPGMSGTNDLKDLPALSRMLDDIRKNRINGVTISKIDRLLRNERTWLTFKESLIQNNIQFYLDGKEIDIANPDVELLLNFQVNLATHESKRTKFRVKQGLKTGMLKGNAGGGNSVAYGYKKDGKKLVPDPVESKVVREIFNLSIDGKGSKAISTILNDRKIPTKLNSTWKDGTVYGILKNTIYKGYRRFDGDTHYFEELQIVNDILFDTVQKNMSERHNYFKNTTNKNFYLLKGLLTCKNCGKKLYGRVKKDRGERTYRCNSKRGHISENCGSRGFNIDKLDKYVLDQLKLLPQIVKQSFDYYKRTTPYTLRFDGDQSNIEGGFLKDRIEVEIPQQIEELEEKKVGVMLLNVKKEDIEKAVKKINDDISELKHEKHRLESYATYLENESLFLQNVKDLIQPLNNKKISNENKQRIVRALISEIEVDYSTSADMGIGKHFVLIHFKINPATNLQISTGTEIDSKKYRKLESYVTISHLDSETVANIDIDIQDNQNIRWSY